MTVIYYLTVIYYYHLSYIWFQSKRRSGNTLPCWPFWSSPRWVNIWLLELDYQPLGWKHDNLASNYRQHVNRRPFTISLTIDWPLLFPVGIACVSSSVCEAKTILPWWPILNMLRSLVQLLVYICYKNNELCIYGVWYIYASWNTTSIRICNIVIFHVATNLSGIVILTG
jgi:hypothetical protein